MVNFTTAHNPGKIDQSCILYPFDYPEYIQHETFVIYRLRKTWWVDGKSGYKELAANGTILPIKSVPPATLLKIQEGALVTPFISKEERAVVRALLP